VREYWATYSVKDHMMERAFVADVMLYDRIVVPHPPNEMERARWADNDWDPDRLDRLLEIMGPDRSRAIPWDDYHEQKWQDRRQAANHLNRDAFAATRDVLTLDLPSYVTGVQADLAYPDTNALAPGIGLRRPTGSPQDSNASLAIVLGKRFLAPAADSYPDPEGALRSALALSADRDFQLRRKAYYRWQREFLEECARLGTVWDSGDRELIIAKATEEMQDLIADEERALRRQKIKLGALFAFTVAGSGLTLAGGGPVTPVGLTGAFVSVGAFLADKLLASTPDKPAPAAFVTSARRHFDWKAP